MTRFASRYHPRYVRSLTYMLQSCEYQPHEYLAWYRRARDFSAVERRKRLVRTPKAVAVYLCIAAMLIAMYVAALVVLTRWPGPQGIAAFVVIAFVAPTVTAYGIVVIIALANAVVQKPVEFVLTRKARLILAEHPGTKIAIAGSYGKTSMREIVREVLSTGKTVAAPPHSYNTPLAVSRFVRTLTGHEDVLVFELGEYRPGDVTALCRIVQPSIGIITGANEAHLEKFESLDRTVSTVFELAQWIGKGTVYVNAENEAVYAASSSNHIRYSRSGAGKVKVAHGTTGLSGIDATLIVDGKTIPVHSGLLGLHQIGPIAVAADLALRFGLTAAQIRDGIARTRPFEHRLQPKADQGGVVTLDDSYNGNPDGVRAIIEFLRTLSGHKRIYVTPGLVEMGDRVEKVHTEIGRQLAEAGIEQVVLIRNSVTPYIEKGLRDAGYAGEVTWYDDAVEAYAALPHRTVRGDVIVLQNDWPDQYA